LKAEFHQLKGLNEKIAAVSVLAGQQTAFQNELELLEHELSEMVKSFTE
jgi:hypothetical protein